MAHVENDNICSAPCDRSVRVVRAEGGYQWVNELMGNKEHVTLLQGEGEMEVADGYNRIAAVFR